MIPKTAYVRSKDMMALARTLPCGHCGLDEYGKIVGSHPNWSWAGKGRSIKAHDLVAALCYDCHTALDQGKEMTREERELMWLKAFYRTTLALVQRGGLVIKGAK